MHFNFTHKSSKAAHPLKKYKKEQVRVNNNVNSELPPSAMAQTTSPSATAQAAQAH